MSYRLIADSRSVVGVSRKLLMVQSFPYNSLKSTHVEKDIFLIFSFFNVLALLYFVINKNKCLIGYIHFALDYKPQSEPQVSFTGD